MTTIIRSTFLTALALLFAVSQLALGAESHHKLGGNGTETTDLPQNTSGTHYLHGKAPKSGTLESEVRTSTGASEIRVLVSFGDCIERSEYLEQLSFPVHWVHWTEVRNWSSGIGESLVTTNGLVKLADCSAGQPH